RAASAKRKKGLYSHQSGQTFRNQSKKTAQRILPKKPISSGGGIVAVTKTRKSCAYLHGRWFGKGPRSGHMPQRRRIKLGAALWTVWAICMGATGCHHQQLVNPGDTPIPRELEKASLPPYVI